MRQSLRSIGPLRIAAVLFAGMVALQSSAAFDLTKIAYLTVTVVCLVGALLAVWRRRESLVIGFARPWLAASAALGVLLAISLLVALGRGTPLLDSVRDLSSYALFAAVPIFALDPQAGRSRKALVAMLVVAGVLGGISWAVEWLGRREIWDLPFNRVVFPSPQLPGALYLFALGMSFSMRGRRAVWIVLAGVTLALFLVTGTRSSLLLPLSALVMVMIPGRGTLVSTLRAYAGHAVVAVTLLIAFQLGAGLAAGLEAGEGPRESGSAGGQASQPPDVLGDRFGTLPTTIGNPASDASIRERMAQYEAAWSLFISSPIVGVGPGHPIEWVDVSGFPRSDFTADTPLVMPAKFGLLGMLVFLGYAVAYVGTVRTALRREPGSPVPLAFVGFGVWTLAGLPLGFAVEDKGASLALILLLALAFSSSRWQSADDPDA